MIKTHQFYPLGYYMFESKSSGRSCFFESEEEIRIFKMLFERYLSAYVQIHKMYLCSEAYRLMIRIRGKEVLIKHYKNKCIKRSRSPKSLFLEEPWRIVSEQMRIFHSVYVRQVNSLRNRRGVLVQSRYSRYYFSDEKSFNENIDEIERRKYILSQPNKKYRLSKRWKKLVNWVKYWGDKWAESVVDRAFSNYVVSELILATLKSHTPPP